MKKIFILMFCMVFLVSTISAFEFDNIKKYDKEQKEILIKNAFGLGNNLAKYKLTYNTDQCLINCRAEGEAELYKDGYLFTDMRFKNTNNKWTNIQEHKIYTWQVDEYNQSFNIYEQLCFSNTTGNNLCYMEVNGSYEDIKYNSYWKEYQGEYLDAGNYRWKIEGKKDKDVAIDWIGSAFGEDFEEWAWWNTTWQIRQQIDIAGGASLIENFTLYLSIPNNISMQSDYDDLRFIDGDCSGIQDTELNADLEFSNSSNAYVWVRIPELSTGTDKICMYFNNSAATATWDSNATWDHGPNGNEVFHLTLGQVSGSDSAGTNDISGTSGSPNVETSCLFGNCYDFVPATNDAFQTSVGARSNEWTMAYWTKFDTTGSSDRVVGDQPGAGGADNGDWEIIMDDGDPNDYFMNAEKASGAVQTQIAPSTATSPDVWYFTTITFNVTGMSTWFNGVKANTDTSMNGQNYSFRGIGGVDQAGTIRTGVTLDGKLDEVWWINGTNWDADTILRYAQQNDSSLVIFGAFSVQILEVTSILDEPEDSFSTIDISITFNGSFNSFNGNLTNTTLFIWNPDGSIFGTNFTTITGILNTSNLSISGLTLNDSYNWNYFACAENLTSSSCSFASSNRTFDKVGIRNNAEVFNATTFETASETFFINVSADGTQTVTANLIYDGINQGIGTKSGNNSEMTFTKIINIPLTSTISNKTFHWNVSFGSTIINTTINNQIINPITFVLCNASINVPYVNFTFKNETTNEESISATISSSFVHWLGGGGTINKTLNFANASENPSYAFCFDGGNRSLNVVMDLAYNNAGSQQRIFTSTSVLSTVTLDQILYLLPTSLGLFNPFSVVNSIGNALFGVKGTITRTLGASTITVASDFSDSSGFVSYFLNPDETYTGTFTLTGFDNNIFTFSPTTDTRNVIMGTAGGVVNGSNISVGTTYSISPTKNSLNNNTIVNFGFNVSSSQTIILISMNITNESNSQLLFVSNAGMGNIYGTTNTGNGSKLIGRYIIQTSEETLSFTKIWFVGTTFIGDYSIFRQLTLYNNYGFKDFIRFIIVFSFIITILIFMSAGEVIETSESKVIVGILLIWAFSVVNWLDTGLVVTSSLESINKLGALSSQFGIAIVSTGAGIFFIFRRIFIRRI